MSRTVAENQVIHAYAGREIYEILSRVISDKMIIILVEQTNLYAARCKRNANFKLDLNEMKKFSGITSDQWLSYVAHCKKIPLTMEDLQESIYPVTMSRGKFCFIKR